MSNRILVTPEQLDDISSRFSLASQQGGELVRRLESSIHQMESQWEGMTRERFFGDYQQARSTMNQFVACLHNVSTELKQISHRFRSTDLSSTSTAAGIGAVGVSAAAGTLGAASLAGSAGPSAASPAMSSEKLSKLLLDGAEAEGSVVERREGGWYGKGITGSASAGLTTGVSAEGAMVEAGYENDYVQGSVSLAKAEVEAQVKNGNLEIGAEATLNKYEGGFNIPLPFTDKELNIGGSASLGVVGGSAEVGKSGLKFHIPLGPGVSLVGVGGNVTVE
ncbi:WXG100 family type VII secretion target [Paenibacillus sp. F411]|uniref:WXG100 family type VII secretion target n=1 Tax=Paenibacillus sp. F411 TaxID=2820239 RepID=UPI001AAEC57C|nr:WXG100 family type VII secretion target [Paenibacillus sp. F411]MBO2944258.1 WXG100 family type VII secretion target [Paenibacillus sp. F411]